MSNFVPLNEESYKTEGCLGFSPTKCAKIFTVCTKLHNMCIDRHIDFSGELVEEDDDAINGELWQQDNGANAVAARIAVINLF